MSISEPGQLEIPEGTGIEIKKNWEWTAYSGIGTDHRGNDADMEEMTKN